MKVAYGDPGGNRTHDPLIKSQLLYQLSYGVVLVWRCKCIKINFKIAIEERLTFK